MSGAAKDWICSVNDLAAAVGGQILSEPFPSFCKVGTDTRSALDGMLFVPLKGEQFDAHNFVAKAVEQKAHAILVHEFRDEWKPLLSRVSFIKVGDTLKGLQDFARYWRRKWEFTVVGITGSNGKTSTKEFTYALIKNWVSTYATKGSFNNHWGLPLSILSAGPEHKVLVLEMGMNHLGELTELSKIAEPNIVVVTNVGRAHIGELGSQENVAKAKEEIYQAAGPESIHIFNLDNEWTMKMQSRSKAQQIKYSSFNNMADVYMRAQSLTWDGLDLVGHIRGIPGNAFVKVLGRQNTSNLMCASAIGLAVGMDPDSIWDSLATIQDSAWGRNQMVPLTNGARVLFDAYNANPDSMTVMLKNIFEMDVKGRRFLVAGDMKELGSFSESAHEELGERAGNTGFEGIYYVGEHAPAFQRGLQKSHKPKIFLSTASADPQMAKEFAKNFAPGDLIAVKGSRGMHLETVVETWPLSQPLGKKP